MKEVKRFKALDGKVFKTMREARVHESTLFPVCKVCGGSVIYFFHEKTHTRNVNLVTLQCKSCALTISVEGDREIECMLKEVTEHWNTLMGSEVPKRKAGVPARSEVYQALKARSKQLQEGHDGDSR